MILLLYIIGQNCCPFASPTACGKHCVGGGGPAPPPPHPQVPPPTTGGKNMCTAYFKISFNTLKQNI